jgi:hypothetical protein
VGWNSGIAEGDIFYSSWAAHNDLSLSSEDQLRYVLGRCLHYYCHEGIHQGANRIIEPTTLRAVRH